MSTKQSSQYTKNSQYARSNTYKKQKEPKWSLRRKAIIIVSVILGLSLLMLMGVVGYAYSMLSGMHENPDDFKGGDVAEATDSPEDIVGLAELTDPDAIQGPLGDVASDPNITNIMLFGLDTRSAKELDSGNTDVIIILSLDKVHNKIKLTSIMRDTLVKVQSSSGKSTSLVRINTLFGRLGPKEAAATIGEYFGVKIEHYATVNFACTASIVDTLGGVELNVTSDEIRQINDNLKAELYKNGQHQMKSGAGLRTLDGAQAVAYARIRHLSGSDFNRTQRQRNVLLACAKKLPGMSATQLMDLVTPLTKYVKTDLSELEMINMAKLMYDLRNADLAQLRVPIDDTWKNESYKGMSILNIDFTANRDAVQQFIFKDVMIDQKDDD